MNIYIGNLDEKIENSHLKEAFQEYGTVLKAIIIKDKYTNKSRCFGFVEMPNDEEALNAIKTLNNGRWEGKLIIVKKAIK
jgi:RNA recognition motif-containing protein